MADYSLTATAQTVASALGSWRFTNGGSVNVFLASASGRPLEVLSPAATITLVPTEDVLAKTSSGTATLTVVAHAVIHSTVSGGTP